MSLQVTRTTIISSFEYSVVSDSRCSTVAFVAARLTDKFVSRIYTHIMPY